MRQQWLGLVLAACTLLLLAGGPVRAEALSGQSNGGVYTVPSWGYAPQVNWPVSPYGYSGYQGYTGYSQYPAMGYRGPYGIVIQRGNGTSIYAGPTPPVVVPYNQNASPWGSTGY